MNDTTESHEEYKLQITFALFAMFFLINYSVVFLNIPILSPKLSEILPPPFFA